MVREDLFAPATRVRFARQSGGRTRRWYQQQLRASQVGSGRGEEGLAVVLSASGDTLWVDRACLSRLGSRTESRGAVWRERETTRWASGRRPESVTPLCDVELRQKRPFEERVRLRLSLVWRCGGGSLGSPLFPIILCRLHRFLSQIPKLSCTRPE